MGFTPDILNNNGELTPDQKLAGDMLLFSTGLMMFASVLWLAIYWSFGKTFSTTIPLVFQGLSTCTIIFYLRTKKLGVFCVMQLSLFLFTPFVLQWSIGNFVNASGVSLWALLAPVGAIVILGTRESVPWFVAYIFMTAMSGFFDYVLAYDVKQLDMTTVAVFFVLNFVSISGMIYVLLWYFSREKNKLLMVVEAKSQEVTTEKELSDRLLLNILPINIADRLKRQETNIADGHADVSVMFADLVNFTYLTGQMSPNETVLLLNDIFSEFDTLAERCQVEKIKTIGDAYMVAGGLADQSGHYVDAVAAMALDMQAFVSGYIAPNGERLALRVGIATGPVVAGVIGRRKFSYDLWGDTVNIASRMCTEALSGHIQVDSVTFRRLHSRFSFDEPHQIQVKGKGQMQVYNLLGRMRGDSSNSPPPAESQ
ncbi:MAG: adenylate/guanylate cyclase domain-containing protein [Rhodocyclaceae bacterium]|jgi:adenylate cyclase|nr:adenylate/guanylate cyclase domain-containing protein [Rhodocyclaceae bacterium]MCE2724092.1 adenylate/guanylate cyclase domain-containing protein [Betaproteobacteria bacterium]MCA3026996.1 adenylate/guanylate cyclase domain-containing protein [Rhodocyclaceae bacterium]MCA3031923.1 adenylate/guanylate cyclase domain-containing protein [Rhodocyclaceae bacterium]MCA3036629.1 adenylate/guanylate cyclase domain-containing protein [Rhodocyclaceae bacterium]